MPRKLNTDLKTKSRTRGKCAISQSWPVDGICACQAHEPGRAFSMTNTSNPLWQRKRLKIFERDGWACQRCFDESEQLEVHHLVYKEGIPYWEYQEHELITLCRTCHQYETDNIKKAIDLLAYNVKTSGLLSDEILKLASYHSNYNRKRRVNV